MEASNILQFKDKKRVICEREILGVDEVAHLLNLKPETVKKKARKGEIPGRNIFRSWTFFQDEILKWIESQKMG